jgi:hypothetical protein
MDSEDSAYRPGGGKGARDGAGRVEPRQEAEGWRASPVAVIKFFR